MYYSYIEIEYVATSFSPARTDLALKLLTEDEEILQCFLNLPCYLLNNEKERRPKKCRKYSADTHSSAHNGHNHFCDSNAEHCYLNLPDDMVEDNPLDLENIKEKQDEANDLQPIGIVVRTLMMSTTYCVTPNQVTMQPIGK
jgi:hypothetical protein